MILLLVASFLLVGLGLGPGRRAPLFSLLGMFGVLGALGWGAATASSLTDFLVSAATGLGAGTLVLAGRFHALRQPARARPWFAMGALLLFTSLVLGIGRTWMATPDQLTWLVELGPDDDIREVEPVLSAHNVAYERAFPSLSLADHADLAQVYLLSGQTVDLEEATARLRLDTENVDHLEPNLRLQFIDALDGARPLLENDPLAASQWDLEATGTHRAHELLQSRRPVQQATIAILDTGVDTSHEDLQRVVVPGGPGQDANGHGSHVAGTAAAATNNRLGVASINWEGAFVRVAAYEALSDNGTGTLEGIAQAVVDAVQDNVDVISMSLGARTGGQAPKIIRDAIALAVSRNIAVVVSAGNEGRDAAEQFPANVDGVIVVAAVDRDLNRASFSNTTAAIERAVSAPGVNILSVRTGGGYVSMSGTSMATPAVSGLLGVLKSLDPTLTPDALWTLVRETATDIPAAAETGPLMNTGAAVERLLASIGDVQIVDQDPTRQDSSTDADGPLQNM